MIMDGLGWRRLVERQGRVHVLASGTSRIDGNCGTSKSKARCKWLERWRCTGDGWSHTFGCTVAWSGVERGGARRDMTRARCTATHRGYVHAI